MPQSDVIALFWWWILLNTPVSLLQDMKYLFDVCCGGIVLLLLPLNFLLIYLYLFKMNFNRSFVGYCKYPLTFLWPVTFCVLFFPFTYCLCGMLKRVYFFTVFVMVPWTKHAIKWVTHFQECGSMKLSILP